MANLWATDIDKPDTTNPIWWMNTDPQKMEFPAHWGQPPEVQTKDLVTLPGDYGRGSSTLASWISEQMRLDEERPLRAKDPVKVMGRAAHVEALPEPNPDANLETTDVKVSDGVLLGVFLPPAILIVIILLAITASKWSKFLPKRRKRSRRTT
mgnify:CR=1 FL=1|jgi:hypothetical protein